MTHTARPRKPTSVRGSYIFDEVTGHTTLRPTTTGTRYRSYFAVPTEIDGIVVGEIYGDADGDGIKSPGDRFTGTISNIVNLETTSLDTSGAGAFRHDLRSYIFYSFTTVGELAGTATGPVSIWTNI
jgi:hypothetical protein